jgi:hypothetical protein
MAFEPVRTEMKLTTGAKHDAWRLSLPKDACRYLGWAPGDTIIVSVSRDGLKLIKKV